MPIIWDLKNDDFSIAVWQSKEPIHELLQNAFLSSEDEKKILSFKSETRKREYLTVRNALRVLSDGNCKITYDSNGKPHLDNDYISISHSHDLIAIMLSKKPGIGIDIEAIHPRIINLSQKFLSSTEVKQMKPGDPIEKLQVLWGAKEVLYKIHSIGGLVFKENLLTEYFDYNISGTMKATIVKQEYEETFQIYYEKIDGYMLTWASR
jgi:4'-phosphopantetheinyl transferase